MPIWTKKLANRVCCLSVTIYFGWLTEWKTQVPIMWNAYLRKCFLLLLSFLPAIENDYKVRRSNAKYSKTDRPQLVIIGTMTITAACVFTNWDVNNDNTIMFYSMTKSLNSFYFRFLLDLQEIFFRISC
jgi:hypothetical protein